MSTIAIKESTKRELLKFISELQMKLGRGVDFDEAIRFLLMYRRKRNPQLLMETCIPTEGTDELLYNLRNERKKDEQRYNEYIGL